ncbi:MAG: serine hydrolase domain-containing protein [bacterium]
MNRSIDAAFKDAISNGAFPAADLLVAKKNEVVYSSHYGDARESTHFDISSLTKPICTATVAMKMVAEGLLKLDDNVYQWLAGARQHEHREITVRMLLNHTSGLPAWQPYYRELPTSLIGTETGKRLILGECFNEAPVASPGEKTIYSDIGYIILSEILEQAGGAPLDVLFEKRVAKPLKLEDSFFVRVSGLQISTTLRHTTTSADQHVPTPRHGIAGERREWKAGEHRRFAPTEDCPWRERVIHGEVHDQNAYALGGVAGHAGLFSTASDIHRVTLELVRCYNGDSQWVSKEIAKEFLQYNTAKPESEAFVLGWNRPSKRNSASGHRFSPNSIGHLGYTGCSIWVDLSKDFWIILLTNRIHPSSTNEKIKAFRPKIHDLIHDELIA